MSSTIQANRRLYKSPLQANAIHYRHTREDLQFDQLPDNPEGMPQDFVIVLDSTGMKLTNRGEWLSKNMARKEGKAGSRFMLLLT
ncbi:MAG: hypothetical protein N3D14_00575 [Aquificaceae bacterium]|nr:hypothetical protein [Aquificaceae bacterium]